LSLNRSAAVASKASRKGSEGREEASSLATFFTIYVLFPLILTFSPGKKEQEADAAGCMKGKLNAARSWFQYML